MAEVRVAMHLTRSYLYFTCAILLCILCFLLKLLISIPAFQAAQHDHEYLALPFAEYQIDYALAVSTKTFYLKLFLSEKLHTGTS